jgi:glycosyltransferase involved in cell wall biosynthesis
LARLGDASAGGPAGKSIGRLSLIARLLYASFGIAIYAVKLRRLLRQIKPDVIQTNGFKMHVLGAIAKPPRVPLIWHIHDYVSSRPLMAWLLQRFSRRCSLALANSNSVKEDVRRSCGDGPAVITLYNGVDTKVFAPQGSTLDLDSLAGLAPSPPGVVRIGIVATLARWKGHETFLRAIAQLPRELAFRAYVIGGAMYQTDGSQYAVTELMALAQKLGISDRIGFTGFVDEPAAAMRALDIVVHASTEPEPFGLVITEGMACGRAVIAAASGGAAEITEPGINSLSHAPGDAGSLAKQILSLATDAALRQSLAEAGRASVEKRFSQSRMAKELIPIYSTLVAKPESLGALIGVNNLANAEKSDRVQGLDSLRFI